ncbi:hypothetical protein SDC9_181468 [bioreactor metagenome]|uniref:Uncharacterized protein n=1 Tax=bioreactor metagenome TaxID=1076179 RepID=A0A645H657_9ZZZZ
MERLMLSGISAMLWTILVISPAFLIGSSPTSSSSRLVLKRMKSCSFSSINRLNFSAFCLRANESGSSPPGNSTTLTFIPSSSNRSMPRKAALIPAASPSYKTVMFSENRWIIRIWPCVSAVPDDATTFSIPA